MCSKEHIRTRSTNFRNALRNQYVTLQKKLYSVLAVPWHLTHSLLSLTYFKTSPIILNSAIFSTNRPDSCHSILSLFLFSQTIRLQFVYNIYNKKKEDNFILQMTKTTAKNKYMQHFTEVRTKQFQLRFCPMEDRRGSRMSHTSTSFSTGKLRCQSRSKSRIFDYSKFLRSERGTWNLKLKRHLNNTPGDFLFHFCRRKMMSAGTNNVTG